MQEESAVWKNEAHRMKEIGGVVFKVTPILNLRYSRIPNKEQHHVGNGLYSTSRASGEKHHVVTSVQPPSTV